MFGSHFFPWLLGGRDSFSQTMTEAFFSWQALGYYVGIIAYIFVANCPRFRAYNGDEVEEPRELADKMANFAGSMMAGVGKAAGMAGQAGGHRTGLLGVDGGWAGRGFAFAFRVYVGKGGRQFVA